MKWMNDFDSDTIHTYIIICSSWITAEQSFFCLLNIAQNYESWVGEGAGGAVHVPHLKATFLQTARIGAEVGFVSTQ